MNKKGAIFHWVFIFLLLAFGVFLYNQSKTNFALATPGEWQTNFLQDYVYPAEQEWTLEKAQLSLRIQQIQQQLAKKGGFIGKSPCGTFDDVALWNTPDQWCVPDQEEFTTAFKTTHPKYELQLVEDQITIIPPKLPYGFKTRLLEKATSQLQPGEYSCLQQKGKYFDGSCKTCDLSCDDYDTQKACQLDACDQKCIWKEECTACKASSCSAYTDRQTCTLDPCKLGCQWSVSQCVAGTAAVFTPTEKLTFISFPDADKDTLYSSQRSLTLPNKLSYDLLEQQARELVARCPGAIEACLRENRPKNWFFDTCDAEEFFPGDKQLFCVQDAFIYNFALDFTPQT